MFLLIITKAYPKEAKKSDPGYSDVNGQPSLVWKATLRTSDKNSEVTPKVIGHGHVLGKNSTIDRNISKITTAKDLFYYIKVKYKSKSKMH